jgi:hypothetical protein
MKISSQAALDIHQVYETWPPIGFGGPLAPAPL